MKFVEIYKLQNDGSQSVIAVCKLTGEEAVCEGEEAFVANLKTEGVLDHSKKPPQRLFPKDGINFLKQLKFAFKSGYLNASDIKEK